MGSIIIRKFNKIFLLVIIFMLSIYSFVFADDTTSDSGIVGIGEKQGDEQVVNHNDLTIDNFPELYKMWILELGAERMQVFNKTGEKVYEKVILPSEFKGKSSLTLKNKYMENDKTIVLSNEYNVSVGGCAFSNNIPCLTFIGDKLNKPDYVLFNSWTNMTTSIAEWCSNPENAKNVIADINDVSLNEKIGNDILTFLSDGGSIVFEPVSFYPKSTEQIYCNDLDVAATNGMQYNTDFLKTIKEDIENSEHAPKEYTKDELLVIWLTGEGMANMTEEEAKEYLRVSEREKEFNNYLKNFKEKDGKYYEEVTGKSIWASILDFASAVVDWFTKDIFYNVGIFKGNIWASEVYTDVGSKFAGYRDFVVERIQRPEFVLLSWTETTIYVHEWETDGFFVNHMPEFHASGLHVDSGMANKYPERYTHGIGKASYIYTDHNKLYSVIVKSADSLVSVIQNLLVEIGLLKNEENMRYGAALVCGGNAVLGDKILIKFHSNLEQISDATGSIDEQYNLYAQIGSSEYTWQKDGTKVTKFPYTYPQDIASAYKNDEGESYQYYSYGTLKQKSDTLFLHKW